MTVCILPKYSEEYSLLVLLVSVYVNLSKNSLFALLVRKAGAKVQLFSEPAKLFEEKFGVIYTIISLFDICQVTF